MYLSVTSNTVCFYPFKPTNLNLHLNQQTWILWLTSSSISKSPYIIDPKSQKSKLFHLMNNIISQFHLSIIANTPLIETTMHILCFTPIHIPALLSKFRKVFHMIQNFICSHNSGRLLGQRTITLHWYRHSNQTRS